MAGRTRRGACKPATVRMYRLIVEKHVLPALGRTPALAVDHSKVADLHNALRATPAMVNQTVDTLSRIWNAAVERGRLLERVAANPCRLVARNPARRRERFLSSAEEFRRLGRALTEAGARQGVSVHAAAAVRLLVLTGCRKSEVLALRWEDVDLDAGDHAHGLEDRRAQRAVIARGAGRPNISLALKAVRREGADDTTNHGVGTDLTARW